MGLLEDIQPWVDEETGLIQAPDGGRDNLPLMTATLIRLLSVLDEVDVMPPVTWAYKLQAYYTHASVTEGLVSVDYHRKDGMSPDNIVALMTQPILTIRQNIFNYGKANFFCYNVEAPNRWTLRRWVWPLLGFIPLMKVAVRKKLWPWEKLAIFVSMLITALSAHSNATNKCLQVLWSTELPYYCLTNRVWRKLMMRKYPGGLQELYGVYFGPSHPFTTYARKDFS